MSETMVDRAALLAALKTVRPAVPRKVVVPITGNIRLAVDGDALQLDATDLEIAIAASCPVTGDTGWSTTAPAHELYELIRQSDDDAVGLSMRGNQLRVATGGCVAKLRTMAVEDFPARPSLARPELTWTLPAAVVTQGMAAARTAVIDEGGRYHLHACQLRVLATHVWCESTDGHRLVRWSLPVDGDALTVGDTLVSARAMDALVALCDDDEPVEMTVTDRHVHVEGGAWRLAAGRPSGQYPATDTIFAKVGDAHRLKMSAPRLLAAVGRCATMRTERSAVRLEIDGSTLTARAEDAGGSEVADALEVEVEAGGDTAVVFSGPYLADMCKLFSASAVVMSMVDANSQVCWSATGAVDDPLRVVIMPMRP